MEHPLLLGLAFGQVGRERERELGAGLVDVGRGGVRSVRGDPGHEPVRKGAGDRLAELREAGERRLRVVPEDLQVDDAGEPELGARGRGGPREARVADRGDSRAEALRRAEARDRDRVALEQAPLAGDVELDPGRKREPVAEARVDRVLEVGVRVHERRDDDRVREGAPLAFELRGGPDGDDAAVLDRHASVAHGRSLDRDDPVGLVDGCARLGVGAAAYASRRASIWAAQRFSRMTEAQIESSKSRISGITSNASETGSTVGSRMATTRTLT